MRKINQEELVSIQGGGLSVWAITGIAAAITFIVGVFDGFTRPLKCN